MIHNFLPETDIMAYVQQTSKSNFLKKSFPLPHGSEQIPKLLSSLKLMPRWGKVTIEYFDEEINQSLVFLRHNMFSFSSYPTNPFFCEKITLISRYQILLKPVSLHHVAARFTRHHQVISNTWTSITFNKSDNRNPLGLT